MYCNKINQKNFFSSKRKRWTVNDSQWDGTKQ